MSHCGQRGFNDGILFDPTPEVTVVRTAPPPSQDGAHGNGWFMACTTWQTLTNGGDASPVKLKFSNPKYLNG
jgi:hypothetical protein